MAVRIVKEEPFEEERVVPLRLEAPVEAPPTARAVPTEPVREETVAVQALAIMNALAAVIAPKLVVLTGLLSAALLTFYAEAAREPSVLAVTAAGMFDGLVLMLAIAKQGDWRR
jgi:hypothetical protein